MAKTKKQTKQKEKESEKQYKYRIKDGGIERVFIVGGDDSYDAFFDCYGELLVELDDGTREFWGGSTYDSYADALGFLVSGLKCELDGLKDRVKHYAGLQSFAFSFLVAAAWVLLFTGAACIILSIL